MELLLPGTEIEYINYNYCRHVMTKELLHLVRYKNGYAALMTTRQISACYYGYPKS